MELCAHDKFEIRQDLDSIEKILSTDIFAEHNYRHPLVMSAFIDLIISLDDLMSKAKRYYKRIDFTDNVLNTSSLQERKKKQVTDVTSLINFVRNAVCHVNEDNRIHGGVVRDEQQNKTRKGAGIFFNRQFGRGGMFESMQSQYADDQSFAFGEHLIYLQNHIIRAYEEAKAGLVDKYPMIYPAQALMKDSPFIDTFKPKMIEKEYVIKVWVQDGPYQQAIDKFDNERFGQCKKDS